MCILQFLLKDFYKERIIYCSKHLHWKKTKILYVQLEYAELLSASGIVVQHSSRHPKVQGSSTPIDHSEREGWGKNNFMFNKTIITIYFLQ